MSDKNSNDDDNDTTVIINRTDNNGGNTVTNSVCIPDSEVDAANKALKAEVFKDMQADFNQIGDQEVVDMMRSSEEPYIEELNEDTDMIGNLENNEE